MLDDSQIYDKLKQMPEPLKAELVHYMEFLLTKYNQAPSQTTVKTKRQPHPAINGQLKIHGDLINSISEDDLEILD